MLKKKDRIHLTVEELEDIVDTACRSHWNKRPECRTSIVDEVLYWVEMRKLGNKSKELTPGWWIGKR